MANCSSDRILIIGAGEVGLATAMRLAKEMPEGGQIHLRTLSSDSLQSRLHELQRRCPPAIATAGSTGDVFFSADLPDESADLARRARVDYLLAPTSAATLRRSSIFRLIEAVRPTIIIDTVNAAYVTRAAAASVLDIARDLHGLHESTADGARAAIARCADDIVLGNGPAIIARYIAALELALREFNVDRYVRVSTTGLGGMGFNCPYTHGEASANVGEALAQKLATSGALHQLLWNLHHTSGADVALIVPAHTLKGDASQFGAEALADLAEHIESFARQCVEKRQTPEELLPQVVKLRPLFEETLTAFEAETNPLVERSGFGKKPVVTNQNFGRI
jgi:HPt (histidine-containing phosphotransfer) domain-containing protein